MNQAKTVNQTVLIALIVLIIGLTVSAVHNVKAAYAAQQIVKQKQARYDNQLRFVRSNIEVCKAALAGDRDLESIKSAEEWLQQKQVRVGEQLEKSNAVTLIELPEVRLLEREAYKWKIYVPPNKNVRLAAIEAEREDELRLPIEDDQLKYLQPLPSGESTISVVWESLNRGRIRVGSSSDKDATVGLTVTAASETFEWCRDCKEYDGYLDANRFPNSTRVLTESSAEKLFFIGHAKKRLQFFLSEVKTGDATDE